MKRKIEVTKGDIKIGEPNEVYYCPVALAIKRALRIEVVYVAQDMTSFTLRGVEFDICLPAKVKNWIARFDKEKEVKPFAFTLMGDNL